MSPNNAIDAHPSRLMWACTGNSEWSLKAISNYRFSDLTQ
jgi:hypothetical protein